MNAMRRKHIKAALVMAGITQAELARELKVSKQTVNGAISGRKHSKRAQEHIAKRLGRPYDELWGDD